MINNTILNENDMKRKRGYNITNDGMIFRDKKTGALLNIRRDEYVNDRLYFSEIMRVSGTSSGGVGVGVGTGTETHRPLRYTQRYDELQSENNNT